jgi:tyrosine-protein kinase Etk/Wzc
LKQTNSELVVVEDSLRNFQQEHGIASVEAQVAGTVTSAVALEGKIAEARAIVDVYQKLYLPGHPDLQRAKLTLDGLLEEQKKLFSATNDKGLMLSFGAAPEIGLVVSRLMRQVKSLEIVKEILMQQYEQAKMQEFKEIPSLRIVDRGKVAINKYKPKRLILIAIAALSSLFLSLLFVYVTEYLRREKDLREQAMIDDAIGQVNADLQRLKRFILFKRK